MKKQGKSIKLYPKIIWNRNRGKRGFEREERSQINLQPWCEIAKDFVSPGSTERLHLMERALEFCSNGIAIFDMKRPDYPVIFVNPAFERMSGYRSEEILGRNCPFLQGKNLDRDEIEKMKAALAKAKECHVILRDYRKDGTMFWNELYLSPVFNDRQELTHFVGIQTDVTERQNLELEKSRAKEELQASQERLSGILDIAKDAIVSVDRNQRIQLFNQGAENIFGYRAEEILGQSLELLLPVNMRKQHKQYFYEFSSSVEIARKMGKRPEIYGRRKDGSEFPAEASISKLKLQDGNIYTVILRDITERKKVEEQLRHRALYDPLTALPNRVLLMERLEDILQKIASSKNYSFTLLFLDLDDFKFVNDSLGHSVGDRLLIALARRLENCLRSCDTLARLGGDEFIILMPNTEDIKDVVEITESIYQQLQLPFEIDGYEIFTNASTGIVLGNSEYKQAREILRHADIAMYHAKAKGKGRFAFFNREMHRQAVARLQIETDLRRARMSSEFEIYYQPIVSLATGKLTSFEALLRWQHSEKGSISPAEFIPIAEETGSILSIGRWVLESACTQMQAWRQKFPQLETSTIAVNISGKQLQQSDFPLQLDRILSATGLDAKYLKLELTETILMENSESAKKTLMLLRARNIKLSLDDFGTGYSSLSYLQTFPINTVKIDRSFVSKITSSDKNAAIIGAILTLAHTLEMEAIAEGIETPRQLDRLKLLGCSQGQGYFFSKPLSAGEFEAFLAKF